MLNVVMMLEHSIYSVISPEGCASILWKDSARSKDAAGAMKIPAPDLLEMKIVDQVIDEPIGGAHRHAQETMRAVGNAIESHLNQMDGMSAADLRKQRRERFLAIGRTLPGA